MSMHDYSPRSQWSSSWSYIIVTIGAVVGLGNIFQFPYLISIYGGLFVLFYIIFELMISLPLIFAELAIGRRGKQNPVGSIDILCLESGKSRRFRYLGWLCFTISFLTLAYYSVQAAFPLSYLLGSLNVISLYGGDESTTVAVQGNAMTSFFTLEMCSIVFLIATMLVIVRGINRGLEKISWIVVPTYTIILISLMLYMCLEGSFVQSLKVLISYRPEQSIFMIMFAAMAYAFFTLNIGVGSLIVYGSYLPYSASFRRSTIIIVLFDAFISFVSYFIIYPLMLKSSDFVLNLTNHNVIYLFSGIPHGFVIAAFFFFAAVLAAWTCLIAMAETATVTLIERFGITRLRATLIIFMGAAMVGTFSAITHTDWMNIMISDTLPLKGLVKNITGNILIPLSAIFIAIFVGWVIKKSVMESELRFSSRVYELWFLLVKYVAPLLIVVLLVSTIVAAL